ncbi:unnamed protein product, partial [Larinioides sclopetarius]
MDIFLEFMQPLYPNASSVEDLVSLGCQDPYKLKESVDYYFTEKEKLNTCVMLMITECQLKRAMGFFTFK